MNYLLILSVVANAHQYNEMMTQNTQTINVRNFYGVDSLKGGASSPRRQRLLSTDVYCLPATMLSALVIRPAGSTTTEVRSPSPIHTAFTSAAPQSPPRRNTRRIRTPSTRISVSCSTPSGYVGLTLPTSCEFSRSVPPESTHTQFTKHLPTHVYTYFSSIRFIFCRFPSSHMQHRSLYRTKFPPNRGRLACDRPTDTRLEGDLNIAPTQRTIEVSLRTHLQFHGKAAFTPTT